MLLECSPSLCLWSQSCHELTAVTVVILTTQNFKKVICLSINITMIIQINQPTACINLSDLLLVVQIQLNMFRASCCPSSGAERLAINLRDWCIWLVVIWMCDDGRTYKPYNYDDHCDYYHHYPIYVVFNYYSLFNTLRTGSFKLFKRPFPGFLTILTP